MFTGIGDLIVKYVLALAVVGLGFVLPSRAYGQPTGLAYVPVPPCTLVQTAASPPGQMGADETRGFLARGDVNLTPQGGEEGGCGIADTAAVIAVTVRIAQAAGQGQLKLWAGNQAEPASVRTDFAATAPASVSELLDLCVTRPCASDFEAKTVTSGADLRVDVVGYFAPAAEGPTGLQGAARTKGETRGIAGPQVSTSNPVGGICAVSCAGATATVSVNDSHSKCTLSFNYPCAPYSCNGSGTGHTCGTSCKPPVPPFIFAPSPQCASGSVCYANGTCGAPLPTNPNTIPGTICAISCTGEVGAVSVWSDSGQCAPSFNYPCAPYSCNGSGVGKTCGTSCTSTSECATGAVCNANGTCAMATQSNTCADASTVLGADGTLTSCAPYHCHYGACWAHCISNGDCISGYFCNSPGASFFYTLGPGCIPCGTGGFTCH